MKRLSVIIISWNEKATLDRCLRTLCDSFDFDSDEIVLVDNGSTDGTIEHVQEGYPKIRVLALPKNIGVGPARNRGIVIASGKYCMTLDNDTILEEPICGTKVKQFFDDHPEVGVWGYMLYNPDGSFQRNARRFPGWLQPLAARIGPLQKFRWARNLLDRHLMSELDPDSIQSKLDVDYVLGANQVFRKEDAALLNMYDESIFFGPEDFEFCLRAKRMGKTNYLVNGPKIVHDHRRRTRKFNMIMVHHLISYYRIMLKYRVNWI